MTRILRRRSSHWTWAACAAACFLLILSPAVAAPAKSARPASVVLLVHGVAWNLAGTDATWGRPVRQSDGTLRMIGMIGQLESRALSYGGTICPSGGNLRLPERLSAEGVRVDARQARLFVLRFSPSANTDGLALKALELAEAVKQLRAFTGAEKVRLVTHSAGGLVARAYLQDALPGVPYRGDVDRLLTIATPHLGSALAEHFGDYLGTRATSIRPSAALIQALDNKLELPDDVRFASIVVRGLGTDVDDEADELNHLVDAEFAAALPVGYRLGDDEVVHVQSQNLRLAACAARYEERTGRPVQYMLVRVADPTPGHWSPGQVRVHVAAPRDPNVQRLVAGLLGDRVLLWDKALPAQLTDWEAYLARQHAQGIVEHESLDIHPMSRASKLEVNQLRFLDRHGAARRYAFSGRAWSNNPIIPFRERWTRVRGTMDLRFDEFGRVVGAASEVTTRRNM